MNLEIVKDRPEEIVSAWDAGDSVWSIELGGLGPGYEQAIQALFVELLRSAGAPTRGQEWGDDVVHKHDQALGGLSGAQVGMAKSLAAAVFLHGMRDCMGKVETERHIQISKFWPRTKGGGNG